MQKDYPRSDEVKSYTRWRLYFEIIAFAETILFIYCDSTPTLIQFQGDCPRKLFQKLAPSKIQNQITPARYKQDFLFLHPFISACRRSKQETFIEQVN